MDVSAVRPSWIAAAGLAVLTSASVAAVSLSGTAGPATAVAATPPYVVAATAVDPTPVSLGFPAPLAPPAPAPAAPVAAVPAPAVVGALAATAPTAATTLTAPAATAPAPDARCTGAGWQARRTAAAVDSLRRPADARAVRIDVRSARADVLGLAHLGERRIELFVRSCSRQSDALLRHVLAHELGHLLDAARMTGASRAEWMRLRGIPAGTAWFGCSGCTDFATPAGDFAEVYAQWQRGATGNRSQLAGAPSRAELTRLAERFFRPL